MLAKVKGMFAAAAMLAVSTRKDQKEAPYKFRGLQEKQTRGVICGFQPPPDKKWALIPQTPVIMSKEARKLYNRRRKVALARAKR